MKMKFTIIGLIVLFLNSGTAFAEDAKKETAKETKEQPAAAADFCPICGPEEEMHGLSFGYRYKGKKYKFCSMECLKAFKADPQKFLSEDYAAHGHVQDGHTDHDGHDH